MGLSQLSIIALSLFFHANLVMGETKNAEAPSSQRVLDADRRVLDAYYDSAKKNSQLNRPQSETQSERPKINKIREFAVDYPLIQSTREVERNNAAETKKKSESTPEFKKYKIEIDSSFAAFERRTGKKLLPAPAPSPVLIPIKGSDTKRAQQKVPPAPENLTPKEIIILDGSNVPKEIEFKKEGEAE